jgi:hypothetical protein
VSAASRAECSLSVSKRAGPHFALAPSRSGAHDARAGRGLLDSPPPARVGVRLRIPQLQAGAGGLGPAHGRGLRRGLGRGSRRGRGRG